MKTEFEQCSELQKLTSEEFKSWQLMKTIEQKLEPWELQKVKNFFSFRVFSFQGKIEILKIILTAKKHRVLIKKVLKRCRREWNSNWSKQHCLIRANPYDWGVGALNILSLEQICNSCNLPSLTLTND